MTRLAWRLTVRGFRRDPVRALLAAAFLAVPGALLLLLTGRAADGASVWIRLDPAAGSIAGPVRVVHVDDGPLTLSAGGQTVAFARDPSEGFDGPTAIAAGPPTLSTSSDRAAAWRETTAPLQIGDRRLDLTVADPVRATLDIVGMRLLAGRLPRGPGELALASDLADRLGGARANQVGRLGERPVAIVGTFARPDSYERAFGAVVTAADLDAIGATRVAAAVDATTSGGSGGSAMSAGGVGPEGRPAPSVDYEYRGDAVRMTPASGLVLAQAFPQLVLVWAAPALTAAAILGLGARRRERRAQQLHDAGAPRGVGRRLALFEGIIVGLLGVVGAVLAAFVIAEWRRRALAWGFLPPLVIVDIVAGAIAALLGARRLSAVAERRPRAWPRPWFGIAALGLLGASVGSVLVGVQAAYFVTPVAAIAVVSSLSWPMVTIVSRALALAVPRLRPGVAAAASVIGISGRAAAAVAVMVAIGVSVTAAVHSDARNKLRNVDAFVVSPDVRVDAQGNLIVPAESIAVLGRAVGVRNPVRLLPLALRDGRAVTMPVDSPPQVLYVADGEAQRALGIDLTRSALSSDGRQLDVMSERGAITEGNQRIVVPATRGPDWMARARIDLISPAQAQASGLTPVEAEAAVLFRPGRLGADGTFRVARIAQDQGVSVRFGGLDQVELPSENRWTRFIAPIVAGLVALVGLLATALVRAERRPMDRALALAGARPSDRRLSAAATALAITASGALLGLLLASAVAATVAAAGGAEKPLGTFAEAVAVTVAAPLLAGLAMYVLARTDPPRLRAIPRALR